MVKANSDGIWGPRFQLVWFALGQINQSIAANSELTLNFNTPGDTEFLLEEIQCQADNQAGDSTHLVFKLEDTTNRQYTNGFVGMNYFSNSGAGTAERPINMNLIFRNNAQIRLIVRNLATVNASNLVFSLYGRKNYSGVSFYDQLRPVKA